MPGARLQPRRLLCASLRRMPELHRVSSCTAGPIVSRRHLALRAADSVVRRFCFAPVLLRSAQALPDLSRDAPLPASLGPEHSFQPAPDRSAPDEFFPYTLQAGGATDPSC